MPELFSEVKFRLISPPLELVTVVLPPEPIDRAPNLEAVEPFLTVSSPFTVQFTLDPVRATEFENVVLSVATIMVPDAAAVEPVMVFVPVSPAATAAAADRVYDSASAAVDAKPTPAATAAASMPFT